ncbi:MAG TPA: hypothetical protein VGC54_11770 [Planctomycetota bacterium]
MLATPALLLVALLPAAPQGPSAKDLFDRELAALRPRQQADGSYGSRYDTANMVLGLAFCPRAYREDDGPFVRAAVQWLATTEPAYEDPEGDALVALALTAVDATRYAPRIQALLDRAAADSQIVAQLAKVGSPGAVPAAALEFGGWAAELPLPAAEETAAAILGGLDEQAGAGMRMQAVARAGVAFRRDQVAKNSKELQLEQVYERGVGALLAARGESGLWEFFGRPEPGISALAARALLGSSDTEARAAGVAALDWLRSIQKEDGSIHAGNLPVYVTSAAVMALAAGGRESDRPAIARAAAYLRAVQADEGEGYSEADRFYGGIGYGNDLRPDLSNLQYALQALHDAGVAAEDPAYARAVIFLERSQNRSESNPGAYRDPETGEPVRAGNDGGGIYYPGNSPAGMIALADGSRIARSYGSMTYALLKCYALAGLESGDPRVTAAVDWVQKHWTLEVNPGFDTLRDPRAGFQGLFYYYLTLAEALRAAGIDAVVGADQARHAWRKELGHKLASLQQKDGTWVNAEAERWMEGNPVLCTAYALCTLRIVLDR